MKKDDLIEIGTYRGKPLRWRVLEDGEDGITVIAEKIIDAGAYAPKKSYRMQPWKTSPLRTRMQKMYETCFTPEEKTWILKTQFRLVAYDNDGNKEILDEADDYLLLPTREEMENLFEKDTYRTTKQGREVPCKNFDRLCEVDPAALENGLGPNEEEERYRPLSSSAYCAYWMMSPTRSLDEWNLYVNSMGLIRAKNTADICGIRPCMRIANRDYPAAGTFRYEEKERVETPFPYEKVRFGQYEGTPLEWLVLEKERDRQLVIAEKGLKAVPYTDYFMVSQFKYSAVRKWLCDEFYPHAFTEEEKERILITTVHTPKSPSDISAWKGPEDTEDFLFLLTYEEVKKYFPAQIDLFCYTLKEQGEPVTWWLRDHSTLADNQWVIGERWTDDYYTIEYIPQSRRDVYVRPAMWIKNGE